MRRGIAVLGAVALTTTLAACGSSAPADSAASGDNPASVADDGAAKAGVLTIWADDTRYDQIVELSKDFTAATQVEVNVVQKSVDSMVDEFLAQVPTGKGPDIIINAHDKLGQMVSNGVVGTVDIANIKDKLAPAAVQGVTYEGQTYGVPYAVESIALIRNNKLTQAEPKTFDEMIEAGKAAGKEYPFIMQMGTEGDPYHMYPFQTSFGAPVFKQEADGSYTSELALGGEGGTKFAEWLKAQGEAKVLDPAISGDIAKQSFIDGKAPFTVTGPWNVGPFREAGMDVSVLPIPSAGGQPAQPFVGVQVFFASAKTENPLLVNKFFEYVGTEDVQMKLYELGKRIPAMPAVAAKVDDADIKAFAEVAGSGVPMPAIPAMGSVWEFWGVTEANIVTGKEQPADGWNKMAENITKAINK